MLRYSHLASVTLGVTDLGRARAFYTRLPGLQAAGSDTGPGVRLFVGADGATLDLVASERPGLRGLGFQMESAAALEELRRALFREGVSWPSDIPAVRIVEPHTGAHVEFLAPASAESNSVRGAIEGFGHIVLRTPRYREAVAFWRDVLGFRLSDEIEGRISLLRCFPNPQHHSLGIARGERRMFHHLNFRVHDATDLDAIARDFAAAGIRIASGPGIHAPSGNRFLYFFDPDGLTLELASLAERFVEGRERAPRVLPDRPESFAIGDVARHPAMYTVGELEGLE